MSTSDPTRPPAPAQAEPSGASAPAPGAGQARVTCAPLAPHHAAPLAALFERSGTSCYCRWYDFDGDKNQWLDRCYNHPEINRTDLLAGVNQGATQGVVAALGEQVVGWMRLEPAEKLTKAYDQRLYRGLPCFDGDRSGVFTIGCFLVDPAQRGQGVARDLLRAGVARAKSLGATALEAFPRRDTMLGPEAVWTGPFELYTAEGFSIVNDFGPYPVMRLTL